MLMPKFTWNLEGSTVMAESRVGGAAEAHQNAHQTQCGALNVRNGKVQFSLNPVAIFSFIYVPPTGYAPSQRGSISA